MSLPALSPMCLPAALPNSLRAPASRGEGLSRARDCLSSTVFVEERAGERRNVRCVFLFRLRHRLPRKRRGLELLGWTSGSAHQLPRRPRQEHERAHVEIQRLAVAIETGEARVNDSKN